MVIVKILGGLGNQMFQYAFASSLKEKGYNVKLDLLGFKNYNLHGGYQLGHFNINIEIATEEEVNCIKNKSKLQKLLRKMSFKNKYILKEKTFFFNEEFLNICDDTYIEGYFQTEKYFKSIDNEVKKTFIFSNALSTYGTSINKQIISASSSCSIHIRRGDYLDSSNKNIFAICDIDYYNRAISMINDRFPNTTYFIFSNDIQWAKKNLKLNEAIYINNDQVRLPHEDLYLMSLCKNNIIANSSFSWWGSWLNINQSKNVIAPKDWFVDKKLASESFDIVPSNYIRL